MRRGLEANRGPSRPGEGGNGLVILIDIRWGYDRLPVWHQIALRRAIDRGWDLSEAEAKRAARALRALQANLGGPAPAPDRGDLEEEEEIDTRQVVALLRRGTF
jgi:hypothetical protein